MKVFFYKGAYLQTENKLIVIKGKKMGRDELGDWGKNYMKLINNKRPVVWHRELKSVFCNNL